MTALYGYPGLIERIIRGDTIYLRYDLINTNGDIIDVTGGKVYVAISKTIPADSSILEITIDPTDAAQGLFIASITDTQTLALDTSRYYYSIQYIDSLGVNIVLDIGTFEVFNSVSVRVSQ